MCIGEILCIEPSTVKNLFVNHTFNEKTLLASVSGMLK